MGPPAHTRRMSFGIELAWFLGLPGFVFGVWLGVFHRAPTAGGVARRAILGGLVFGPALDAVSLVARRTDPGAES